MLIDWEKHDDVLEGFQSRCGRFEVIPDPVYGYLSLRAIDDPTLSLAEGKTLEDMTRVAEAVLARNIVSMPEL